MWCCVGTLERDVQDMVICSGTQPPNVDQKKCKQTQALHASGDAVGYATITETETALMYMATATLDGVVVGTTCLAVYTWRS